MVVPDPGALVRDARERHGIRQATLARRAGTDRRRGAQVSGEAPELLQPE